MTPVGFEPTISAGERPKTYALERVATGTGETPILQSNITSYLETVACEFMNCMQWIRTSPGDRQL